MVRSGLPKPETRFDPGVRKILEKERQKPLWYFLPENSYGQKETLLGYSACRAKSNMT